jgi:hypothetical protein
MHFCRNVVVFTVAKSSIYKKWNENGLSLFWKTMDPKR